MSTYIVTGFDRPQRPSGSQLPCQELLPPWKDIFRLGRESPTEMRPLQQHEGIGQRRI